MFCTQPKMQPGIRGQTLDSYPRSATCQSLDLGKVKVTYPLYLRFLVYETGVTVRKDQCDDQMK